MGYEFTREDVRYLTSEDGIAALTEVDRLELSTRTHLADIGRVRARFADRSAVLVETVLLRRRAVGKIDGGRDWLFTDDALQQTTPSVVARRRAHRVAGRAVHDVTCSVGAELSALVGIASAVIGSDLDPVRLAMAQHNVPGATVVRADALVPCTRDTVVLADPARRAGGRRRHDPAALQPPLPDLLEAYRGRDLSVKCAPDWTTTRWSGQARWRSSRSTGACARPACGRPGSRGGGSPSRDRADRGHRMGAHRRRTGRDPRARTGGVDRRPGRGGGACGPGAALRGPARALAARPADRVPHRRRGAPGVRGFRIIEQLKYSEKALRQELARLDCGVAEILVRGVDVDPAVLRPRLKLRGSVSLSVVLTRIGRTPVAFVCAAGVRV
ncbi:hypothetical protein BTZ20_2030 [Rhodococcus sp. MTM3W5.2]|nr:hypothetical protein BTZ20_2030 [Rhodococcus sp. MTM3W5.2]